ncbi:MAG: hypothetical protein K9L22_12890 [Methylococcaceae bacterium]|nr:hypothetical protein [Methylococcaceae bacterium]
MKLKSANVLKAAIAIALSVTAYQANAATATYDPATGVVDIPVVDVLNGAQAATYSAKLQLQGDKLTLTSIGDAASVKGARVTFDGATNALHFPSVKILGSNDELYAKLKIVPGSNPIAFTLDQLQPTTFPGCPDFAAQGPIAGTCVLSGELNRDVTLTANTTWILSGGVYVGGDRANQATLTINPGAELIGESGLDFLYVRRGSKIMAEGTPDQPIVMTGPSELSRGEWGGLVIAGNAPVNGCAEGVTPCEVAFEAITTEKYGGTDIADSSGLLKYVQIKYAGYAVRPNEELNGLTMLGVGSGTMVDFVQVHQGLDDGIEMFGGTVQLKHVVLTDIGDDSLDWGSGWRGKAQYVLIKQADDDGDLGIEADNNPDNNDALPRAQPLLANMSLFGSQGNPTQGALFRRGTGVNVYNSIFSGFANYCVKLDGEATYINGGSSANALGGELTMAGTYVNCPTNFADKSSVGFTTEEWFTAQAANVAGDPMLDGMYPAAGSHLTHTGVAITDSFADDTNYIGAFKDANDKWADEWTVTDSLK